MNNKKLDIIHHKNGAKDTYNDGFLEVLNHNGEMEAKFIDSKDDKTLVTLLRPKLLEMASNYIVLEGYANNGVRSKQSWYVFEYSG